MERCRRRLCRGVGIDVGYAEGAGGRVNTSNKRGLNIEHGLANRLLTSRIAPLLLGVSPLLAPVGVLFLSSIATTYPLHYHSAHLPLHRAPVLQGSSRSFRTCTLPRGVHGPPVLSGSSRSLRPSSPSPHTKSRIHEISDFQIFGFPNFQISGFSIFGFCVLDLDFLFLRKGTFPYKFSKSIKNGQK